MKSLGECVRHDHSRCPGTAQKIIVKITIDKTIRNVTKAALPTSNFFTYGSRIGNVLNGVVSLRPKNTNMGSSSY